VYTYSLRDDDESILASFWLLATDQALTIWSSLPHSVFNYVKDKLMPEPLPWDKIEYALTILHEIIDWVEENDYHKRFAYHPSVSEEQRQSFAFALDYRAIYHHPSISLCSSEVNEYQFHRYQQELDASIVSKPHRFMAKKKSTTRKQFEVLLENGDEDAKQWYVEHYNEINSFDMTKDEYLTIVFAFDGGGELVALVFNKGIWMI
jgi:hypothetical protein